MRKGQIKKYNYAGAAKISNINHTLRNRNAKFECIINDAFDKWNRGKNEFKG